MDRAAGQLWAHHLGTGLTGAEKDTVEDLRAGAEVDPEFLAQPGALGEGVKARRRALLRGVGPWGRKGPPVGAWKGHPVAER